MEKPAKEKIPLNYQTQIYLALMVMKILQLNISGYLKNYNDLLPLINIHELNIVWFQETHIHSQPVPILIGYHLHKQFL